MPLHLDAHELALSSLLGCLPPPVVDLAYPLSPSPAECDRAAVRTWERHVDAGSIGLPAPPPAPLSELRLASLAAILGHRA